MVEARVEKKCAIKVLRDCLSGEVESGGPEHHNTKISRRTKEHSRREAKGRKGQRGKSIGKKGDKRGSERYNAGGNAVGPRVVRVKGKGGKYQAGQRAVTSRERWTPI